MIIGRSVPLFVAVLSILEVQASVAQVRGSSQQGMESTDKEDRRSIPALAGSDIALESTIDPKKYYVGPSDVFSVNLSVKPEGMYLLTVTPEGTLIIPTIGEIKVSDLTLAQAKERVIGLIRQQYRTTGASMTLVRPRPVVVIVSGNVLNPGSYVLASYYRVDKAIEEANKLLPYQHPSELRQVQREMSTRNVSVRHRDGSSNHVDIRKYRAARDETWNPYLREGDVVVVPRNDQRVRAFGVYGEVNSPARYEFVEGDSLKDALLIANGFTNRAIRDSVIFSRVQQDGEEMSTQIINAEEVLAGRMPDFPLQPGDRIVVRAQPDLRGDDIVTLEGEVLFPGVYPVTRSRTHLSQVLRDAGGFTDFASLKNAELIRSSVEEKELELERLESARGGVTPEDSAYYHLETDLRLQKEIVNVNFEQLVLFGDSTQDVLLKDGDLIRIPSTKGTVYVFGQVVSTGHVAFVPGKSVEYYISKAGGVTERARDDIKIVKAKTKQWLAPDETIIEEGDYVWIPKTVEHPFGYYLAIIAQSAAIISIALSVVLLATRN